MSHHDDAFPTIEADELEAVTGGADSDAMSTMLPMMMMMRNRQGAAAAAPAAPVTPKILLNGVEQQATMGPNGLSYNTGG